jgi:hypothetical protein
MNAVRARRPPVGANRRSASCRTEATRPPGRTIFNVDEEDRAILETLSRSSELTALHRARLVAHGDRLYALERRLVALARQGLVEAGEFEPSAPKGQPPPAVTGYGHITEKGRAAAIGTASTELAEEMEP